LDFGYLLCGKAKYRKVAVSGDSLRRTNKLQGLAFKKLLVSLQEFPALLYPSTHVCNGCREVCTLKTRHPRIPPYPLEGIVVPPTMVQQTSNLGRVWSRARRHGTTVHTPPEHFSRIE
jgi:hypothetical protein